MMLMDTGTPQEAAILTGELQPKKKAERLQWKDHHDGIESVQVMRN